MRTFIYDNSLTEVMTEKFESNVEKAKKFIDKEKKSLDDLLKLNNGQINSSDENFINYSIESLENIFKKALICSNHSKSSFFLADRLPAYDTQVLNKIKDHTNYKIDSGKTRYKIGLEFLSSEEVSDLVDNTYSEFKNVIDQYGLKFITSISDQLKKGFTLSSKQVIYFESIIEKCNKIKSLNEDGKIFLFPRKDEELSKYMEMLVNYATNGKRSYNDLTAKSLVEIKNKYSEDGIVDLSNINQEINDLVNSNPKDTSSIKNYKIDQYTKAVNLLEKFLNKVDLEKQELFSDYAKLK